MATASFNGAVLANSDSIKIVDGNVYFPQTSIDCRFLKASPDFSNPGFGSRC